jgi:hypothetical protein
MQQAAKVGVKRHLSIIALLVVLALGSLGMVGCGNDPGIIRGTITQEPDKAPVPDAQVVVFQLVRLEKIANVDAFEKGVILYKATTDQDGAYSMTVEPDEYVVEVWVPGRATKGRQVRIKSGRALDVDFTVAAPSP